MIEETYDLDQDMVDSYLQDTLPYVEKCSDEGSAIMLLRRIKNLVYVSDEFFVPDYVYGWEEMALSYIQSNEAYFRYIQYDITKEQHKIFFDAIHEVEPAALAGAVSKEELFLMVKDFNDSISDINVLCDLYHMLKFSEYTFKEFSLQIDYDSWLNAMYG